MSCKSDLRVLHLRRGADSFQNVKRKLLSPQNIKISNVFENWMKGTVDGDVYVDDLTTPTALVVVIPFYSANKQPSNNIYTFYEDIENLLLILSHCIISGYHYWIHTSKLVSEKLFTEFHLSCIQEDTFHYKFMILPDDTHIIERPVPVGFYLFSLQHKHGEVISSHYPYLDPVTGSKYFEHQIDNFESVGLFKDTDPPELVSWIIQYPDGYMGHFFTLEKYRCQGFGSAVFSEMCRKIKSSRNIPVLETTKSHVIEYYKTFGFVEIGDNVTITCRFREKVLEQE